MGEIRLMERRLVCENSVFLVHFDSIEDDHRLRVPDYLVLSLKTSPDGADGGAAVLPVLRDGAGIGLLRIYRHAVRSWSWEIPRGFQNQGEAIETTALRELSEETGFRCASDRLVSLGTLTPDAGVLASRLRVFAALDCEPAGLGREAEVGHRELRVFSPDELDEMIGASKIQDPATIVGFYRYLRDASRRARAGEGS